MPDNKNSPRPNASPTGSVKADRMAGRSSSPNPRPAPSPTPTTKNAPRPRPAPNPTQPTKKGANG